MRHARWRWLLAFGLLIVCVVTLLSAPSARATLQADAATMDQAFCLAPPHAGALDPGFARPAPDLAAIDRHFSISHPGICQTPAGTTPSESPKSVPTTLRTTHSGV